MEHYCPKARRILLVPESHTRNMFYLESLAALKKILEMAGIQVRMARSFPISGKRCQLHYPPATASFSNR